MTLWLLGANGLVGSALKASINCLASGREVDIGKLEDLRAFVRKFPGITGIVNGAAYTNVNGAETHREEAFLTNAVGPENLGIVAQEIGAQLLHISSDYVFPGDGNTPLKESDPTGPCNYYAYTKLEGEKRLSAVCPDCAILRVSWVFGQGGKNFVSQLLHNLRTQQELQVVFDQWSRYTYAPDLALVILQLLGHSGVYHFANEGVTTKYEFALAMREEAEKLGMHIVTDKIIPVSGAQFPSPCKRPIYTPLDTTKIEKMIKIRSWREALQDYLEALIV